MGLIARAVEEAGIPTTSATSALDITQAVKPPRAAFVNFPLGHQTGKPFDRESQLNIVKDCLNLLRTATESGKIVELPYRWAADNAWEEEAMGAAHA